MEVSTTKDPLSFACPACGATANQPCVRINGATMPTPHTKRKYLALGITETHADVNRTAARILKETRGK